MIGNGHVVGPRARQLERLLGLKPYSLRRVERRDRVVVLTFRQQIVGPGRRARRTLRLPARRVEGYRPRSVSSRPRDQRARARVNARRMALFLESRLGLDCPVVAQALFDHDLGGIEELREALRALLMPRCALALSVAAPWDEQPLYVPKEWCP